MINTKSVLIIAIIVLSSGCFRGENTDSNVYGTWDVLELDKCATAWVLTRFVNKDAEFNYYPKGTSIVEEIPFDTPEAEIKRYHKMSAIEYLIVTYNIQDPAAKKLAKMVHDIEINYWGTHKSKLSKKLNEDIRAIIDNKNETNSKMLECFEYFDDLYKQLKTEK